MKQTACIFLLFNLVGCTGRNSVSGGAHQHEHIQTIDTTTADTIDVEGFHHLEEELSKGICCFPEQVEFFEQQKPLTDEETQNRINEIVGLLWDLDPIAATEATAIVHTKLHENE